MQAFCMCRWSPYLLSRAGGMLMFSEGGRFLFQRPKAGLAAARMAVRVLRVVVIPALAMLTVCCSITCTAKPGQSNMSIPFVLVLGHVLGLRGPTGSAWCARRCS